MPRMCARKRPAVAKIAKAELEALREPTAKHLYKARTAKADAEYEVNKEKCDDLSGNPKDVCKKDAKAAHAHALEAAKVDKVKAEPAKNAEAKAADVAEARKGRRGRKP